MLFRHARFRGQHLVTNEDGDQVLITNAQACVIAALAACTANRGYPPTFREISAMLGIRSTNAINDHFIALEKRKLLERGPRDRARTLRLRIMRPGETLKRLFRDGALARLSEVDLDQVLTATDRLGPSTADAPHCDELITQKGARLRWVAGIRLTGDL